MLVQHGRGVRPLRRPRHLLMQFHCSPAWRAQKAAAARFALSLTRVPPWPSIISPGRWILRPWGIMREALKTANRSRRTTTVDALMYPPLGVGKRACSTATLKSRSSRYPDRARAAPRSLPRGVPRILPVARAQPKGSVEIRFPLCLRALPQCHHVIARSADAGTISFALLSRRKAHPVQARPLRAAAKFACLFLDAALFLRRETHFSASESGYRDTNPGGDHRRRPSRLAVVTYPSPQRH
jgi:hypothetical protein